MKRVNFYILILFIAQLSYSQSFIKPASSELFNVQVNFDPGASLKEQGINLGIEAGYFGPLVYTKAGVEFFSGLPRKPYFDWHGAVGINLTSGQFDQVTYYSGVRLGRIYRGSYGAVPLLGFEFGINVKLLDNLSIGIRGTYDRRRDQELFNDPTFWRLSSYGSIVYTIKKLK